jgi:hypothetical protein
MIQENPNINDFGGVGCIGCCHSDEDNCPGDHVFHCWGCVRSDLVEIDLVATGELYDHYEPIPD